MRSPHDAAVAERVRRLGPWFHDLDLDGVRTAPDHPLGDFLRDLWRMVSPAFPANMRGKTVLDIGCNAGFYSFKLADRGARVTGVDHGGRYLRQARYAADVLGHDVELIELDAYDVADLGRRFDYVLFMGVFYHLRYPLLALDRVRRVVGQRLVFQTMVRGARGVMEAQQDYPFEENAAFDDPLFPRLHFVEHSYAGDATNWWIPNDSGAAALLRAAGFRIDSHAAPGVYFCSLNEEQG
ncbi:MAG: TIGR04290 family methyltransferase [Gemmatimonadota bacterium]